MSLAEILAGLLERAQHLKPGQHVDTRLGSGLKVIVGRAASTGRRVISLSRTSSTAPSRKEAEVVAAHAGWTGAEIIGPVPFTSGFKGYIINEPRQADTGEQGRLL